MMRDKIHLFFYNMRMYLRFLYYEHMTPCTSARTLKREGSCKLIVSLTSYGIRLRTVDLCIKSLLNQTLKPDEIRLYLGSDVTDEMIPDKLLKLQKYGLKIIKHCEDIKPHKKYFFAMQDNPKDIIITVDDDMIYNRTLIECLYHAHREFPQCIICTKARRIIRKKDGSLENYLEWPYFEAYNKPTYQALPTGFGGVLYPPDALSRDAFDLKLIKALCLEADDIWLRMMGVRRHTPVVVSKSKRLNPSPIKQAQAVSLNAANRYQGRNDIYLRQVEEYFHCLIDQEPTD